MAVTVRSVVYTLLATSVVCKQLRDVLCLAAKIRNPILRGLGNGLGGVSGVSKTTFGRGSGEDTLRGRFWTNFELDVGSDFEL